MDWLVQSADSAGYNSIENKKQKFVEIISHTLNILKKLFVFD